MHLLIFSSFLTRRICRHRQNRGLLKAQTDRDFYRAVRALSNERRQAVPFSEIKVRRENANGESAVAEEE